MAYGDRYLSLTFFISYCKKLKVNTDEKELEYYEQQGIMYPSLRLIKPDGFVKEEYEYLQTFENYPDEKKWPDFSELYNNFINPDIKFDAYLENNNKFLIKPGPDNYLPWDDYKVLVGTKNYGSVYLSSVIHYYSYWQVYQLYKIQSFPDLYKYKFLDNLLTVEQKKKISFPRSQNTKILSTFDNQEPLFDALSYYISYFNNEEQNTFEKIDEIDGIKTLSDNEFQIWKNKITYIADNVAKRFNLNKKSILEFVSFLLNLLQKYKDSEKYKLAKEIENDVRYCIQFVSNLTNKTTVEVVSTYKNLNFPLWEKKNLINIFPALRYAEGAKDSLSICYDKYQQFFEENGFEKNQINEIIEYCLDNNLLILLYSLDQMVFSNEEIHEKNTSVQRYIAIKNLATCFEYLLFSFLNEEKYKSLFLLIKCIYQGEEWIDKTISIISDWGRITNFTNYINKYDIAKAEEKLESQKILLSYLARNLFVHSYPPNMWVFRNVWGELYDAIEFSIIISFIIAKKKRII